MKLRDGGRLPEHLRVALRVRVLQTVRGAQAHLVLSATRRGDSGLRHFEQALRLRGLILGLHWCRQAVQPGRKLVEAYWGRHQVQDGVRVLGRGAAGQRR